ncbi:S1 RNA binding domain protein [Clostridium acidisoli DSM 12555]|jgi:S1 RNA binding domain protein|uniref:S1 RNA binding domain protein n=1 Tax=Clostridium acidisoli DSM 12555 TaxID=1121291 RepID=A0A1W1XWK6_9CLOT|nr:S1 domain-containing RNA-binding protein [Clostridium acidisoli]SMC28323.1 S1 RNA binding domain protein [Clostridium acidisoli DSM 12555]
MTLKAGTILEGTVINITNFGAFVDVEGKTGLVHISEVADTFVKDIKDYLKEQDKVKVKVLAVDDGGKISLSIKQASIPQKSSKPIDIDWTKNTKTKQQQQQQGGADFEDRLSKFLKDSEERFQDLKRHQEAKGHGGYRKGSY